MTPNLFELRNPPSIADATEVELALNDALDAMLEEMSPSKSIDIIEEMRGHWRAEIERAFLDAEAAIAASEVSK